MDRADSYGGVGPLYMEIAPAMMMLDKRPALINKVYGLGGKDYMPSHAEMVINEMLDIAKTGKIRTFKEYIGVRE